MAAWPEIQSVIKDNRYELILSGNSVSDRIKKNNLSDELFSCKSLNFLQISDTCLNEISPKIKMLDNLTSLVLHSNNLSKLCPEIGCLIKLKFLNVSNNNIEELPSAIGKLQALTSLNVSSNKISEIPDLTNNTQLSTVDFSHNTLTEMTQLCNNQLIRLSEIHLKKNYIKVIPPEINVLTALKFLDVSSNEITQATGELTDISKLKGKTKFLVL